MKVKDALNSFQLYSNSFHNSLGDYGSKSNSSGSCSNPKSGSLFSPVGHKSSASIPVGGIASTLTTIIKLTGDSATCYSTSSTWAVAFPISSDSKNFYCVDSKGSTFNNLTENITSALCK